MRILHLMNHLSHGGAERQLSYLGSELARMGHQVHVAYLYAGPNLSRLADSQVVLQRLRCRNNNDPNILWQLVRLIREVKPDIIHTWIVQMDILGGLAATITRTPWIIREPSSELAYPNTWKSLLRRWLVGQTAAIVSNSAGGDLYWQKYYKNKRRYIIPNGLPCQEIETIPASANNDLGLPSSKKIVLFVGRFDSQKYRIGLRHIKNLDNFLLALAQLQDDPDIVGVICGDGPLLPEFQAMARGLGIAERVLILGFVENVWSLMKRAEVFVSLSHFEGFPNTVMEAMACGCPLVVSDIPEHRQFLDESCALLVNRFQPEEIAGAIRRTLEDSEGARRRAHQAKQKSQSWTVTLMAEQYEKVYLEVLARRSNNKPMKSLCAG